MHHRNRNDTRQSTFAVFLSLASCLSLPVLIAGCSAAANSGPGSDWGRPADGLLNDGTLQAVVDAQIRRDGATLLSYLGNAEPEVRARAAFALGSVQDARARPALLEALGDEDGSVRADAAFALGQLTDTTGTRVLVEQLRVEPDNSVRLNLIQATGKAGGREATALLLRTSVTDAELPAFALALARIGNRGIDNALAVERLYELSGHTDATVRRNAAFFFGRVTSPSFWSPVIPRLRERLASYARDDQAAMWLLRALASQNNPADTDAGRVWLAEGQDWRIRHAAAELLRQRRADGVVTAALRTALDDASPHVRGSAAQGLAIKGRRLTDQDQEFIETWIRDHPSDRHTVAALLPAWVTQDPAAVILWAEGFPQDSFERAAAVRALTTAPDAAIVEREFATARGDGQAAHAALDVIGGRIAASNQERLRTIFTVAAEAIQSADPTKVQMGSMLLANPRLVPLGSVDALSAALNGASNDIAATLYRALAATGEESTIFLLQEGLASSDASVQAEAAAGLEALTGEWPVFEAVTAPMPSIDWDRLVAHGRHPRLVLETLRGEILAELDSEQAPLTAQTLMGLAASGALDGVPFHRVVAAFVVQGGDVTSRNGFGAAPETIRSEFTRLEFGRGVLGMASAGKDTEGSQFFITHLITPHLNGGYTAFGRVIAGQEFVDDIVAGDPLVRAYVVP